MVIFPISIFSQIRSEGGGHQISFFSQIQNSPHYPRGGGSRKLWTFSTIWDIFFLECSPNLFTICSQLVNVPKTKSPFFHFARPVYKLGNSHIDENCSEFCQHSNAIFRTSLTCSVKQLRYFVCLWEYWVTTKVLIKSSRLFLPNGRRHLTKRFI